MKDKTIKHRKFATNTDRAVLSQHYYLVSNNICIKCHKQQNSFSMLNDNGLCPLCSDKK